MENMGPGRAGGGGCCWWSLRRGAPGMSWKALVQGGDEV